MPAPVTVKNSAETWTAEADPTRKRGKAPRMQVRAGAGQARHGWIYFQSPVPPGATIISAVVRLWNGDEWTTAATVSLQRPAARWSINKINWNNEPALTGPVVSITKATAPVGTMWEWDVATTLQSAVNAGLWYGFRVSTNATFKGWFHTSESDTYKYRPTLIVEWSEGPQQPEDLSPSNGRYVSVAKPILVGDFTDLIGDMDMDSQQVQFGASEALLNAGTTTFDSGQVAATSPEYDTNDMAGWGGLADAATISWRYRVWDGAGIPSPWSLATTFGRLTKGVLTITSPTGGALYNVSPIITWTFTGRTQKHYWVAIALGNNPNEIIWDSGKVTSTEKAVTVPEGVITDPDETYTVIVRVWDDQNREATPGDPVYVQATQVCTLQYDAADATTTVLGAVSDPMLPMATLTWTKGGAVATEAWVILRSDDGGDTWKVIDYVIDSDVLVSGSNYSYIDDTVPSYEALVWRVIPVAATNHRMTSHYNDVSGQVRRLAPFLFRPDGGDAVCFINPIRTQNATRLQNVTTTLSGDQVLMTQTIGKRRGKVQGRFIDDALPGVSAKTLLKRFLRLRADSGVPMRVGIANETIPAVAFNFDWDTLTDASGITYAAEFEWAEI